MTTRPWAYQGTATPIYLEIPRSPAYLTLDMTTITSVIVVIYKPGAAGVGVPWTFTPDPTNTTADLLVASYQASPTDLPLLGKATLIATLYVGSNIVATTDPGLLPVRSAIPGR